MKNKFQFLAAFFLLVIGFTACDDDTIELGNPSWEFQIFGTAFADTIFSDRDYTGKILNLNFNTAYNFVYTYSTPIGLRLAEIDAEEDQILILRSSPTMNYAGDSTFTATIPPSSSIAITEGEARGFIRTRPAQSLNFHIGYLSPYAGDAAGNNAELRIKTNIGSHPNDQLGIQDDVE